MSVGAGRSGSSCRASRSARYPLDDPMPTEQTLTPDDLSSMQILTVPDVWPPVDCAPAVGLPCQPTGFADADGAGGSPNGGGGLDEPADGGQAWPRQFAVLLAETLTGDRPARQIAGWLS